MAFSKGQSGNPGGRPKDKIWADAVRKACFEEDKVEKIRKLDLLARKLVTDALGGDPVAMQEIGNRLDGKPVQQQVHTGPDDGPVRYQHEHVDLTGLSRDERHKLLATLERISTCPDRDTEEAQ